LILAGGLGIVAALGLSKAVLDRLDRTAGKGVRRGTPAAEEQPTWQYFAPPEEPPPPE
jgi:hypothetical protein